MTTDLSQLPEILCLKPKQRVFVLEYLTSLNGTQSAINAKYEKKYAHITASKLLRTTKIQEAIKACGNVIDSSKEYTPEKIKAFWIEIMEDKSHKADTRVRCSELLAKANSMFKDNNTQIAIFSDNIGSQLLEGFKDSTKYIDVNPSTVKT